MWRNCGRFATAGNCDRQTTRRLFSSEDDSPSDESGEEDSPSDESTWASAGEGEEDSPRLEELDITRRQKSFGLNRVQLTPTQCSPPSPSEQVAKRDKARQVYDIQELWRSHAKGAANMYPPCLWRLLQAVHLESKVTQTNVLKAVKPLLPSSARKDWPSSRKHMDDAIQRKMGSISSRITRRVVIDLDELTEPIVFEFIDPVFAWANCAYKLSEKHEMHWKYKPLVHPVTGERLFGASVANGDIMREACRR